MDCHGLGRLYLVLVNDSMLLLALFLGGREGDGIVRWESRLEVTIEISD